MSPTACAAFPGARDSFNVIKRPECHFKFVERDMNDVQIMSFWSAWLRQALRGSGIISVFLIQCIRSLAYAWWISLELNRARMRAVGCVCHAYSLCWFASVFLSCRGLLIVTAAADLPTVQHSGL